MGGFSYQLLPPTSNSCWSISEDKSCPDQLCEWDSEMKALFIFSNMYKKSSGGGAHLKNRYTSRKTEEKVTYYWRKCRGWSSFSAWRIDYTASHLLSSFSSEDRALYAAWPVLGICFTLTHRLHTCQGLPLAAMEGSTSLTFHILIPMKD